MSPGSRGPSAPLSSKALAGSCRCLSCCWLLGHMWMPPSTQAGSRLLTLHWDQWSLARSLLQPCEVGIASLPMGKLRLRDCPCPGLPSWNRRLCGSHLLGPGGLQKGGRLPEVGGGRVPAGPPGFYPEHQAAWPMRRSPALRAGV